MKIIYRLLFFVITFTTAIEQCFSQERNQSFKIHIPFKPDLVIIDRKPTIYYELYLTAFASDLIEINNVEVFDTIDSTIVASIGKDNVKKRLGKTGTSAVIYIELTLQNNKPNAQLSHRLEFARLKDNGEKLFSVEGAPIQLSDEHQIVLGPPLSGGPWAAIYDPSWERGHRKVIYTVDGKARIPGRFAIDFMKLDNQGRYAKEDNNLVKNYYGYGMDVFAVADGIVASTRDDFSESATLSDHPKYTADKATGNYISIDIGNNHIVFYEHLKPGSIKVKPGQQVKKADIIAAVGFTGQTTHPHLHFHVANTNSPLGAEGIPFVFERFTVLGSYTDFEKFGKEPWLPKKHSVHSVITKERPAPNTVIKFQL